MTQRILKSLYISVAAVVVSTALLLSFALLNNYTVYGSPLRGGDLALQSDNAVQENSAANSNDARDVEGINEMTGQLSQTRKVLTYISFAVLAAALVFIAVQIYELCKKLCKSKAEKADIDSTN